MRREHRSEHMPRTPERRRHARETSRRPRILHGLPLLILLTSLLAACQSYVPSAAEGEIVSTRVPLPEATPGMVEQKLTDVVEDAGLAEGWFAELAVGPLVNLGLVVLFVVAGYYTGIWLLNLVQRKVLGKLAPEVGEKLDQAIGAQLRWLILIGVLYIATLQLRVPGDVIKRAVLDILFLAGAFLVFLVLWRTLDVMVNAYDHSLADSARQAELEPALQLLTRLAHMLLVILVVTITLGHFGINVAALAAAVGLVGLALSLAAKDTIADAIAGMIILFDKPFRVGDRIEIETANTWGDVTEIGLRSTRILTRDNRLIIVPNSIIGANQIINYSYPDPFYRIQLHVGIAYGTDIEQVRALIVATVKEVDGVYPEKGVDALYIEMGDSAMIFRVRWWIETYADTRRMVDKVNTALQHAFDEQGIICPYPTQSIILQQETPSVIADA
jgi:MscS family membrane protein